MNKTEIRERLEASNEALIDLREIKREVLRSYKPGHPIYETLIREPDFMSRTEWQAKVGIYVRLILSLRAR